MNRFLSFLMAGIAGLFGVFCLFGALASFEPSGHSSIQTGWLVAYVALGILSAASAGMLLLAGGRRRPCCGEREGGGG